MAKTTISACAQSEPETKSLLEKFVDINALRKPLKMTATLKRRALKKKIKPKTAQTFSDRAGTATDRSTPA